RKNSYSLGRLARHEQSDTETENEMVAACAVHSARAAAARRRSALARVLSGLHHFPAHRRLVLLVYSRTRRLVCVFRQPHLARLHRGASLASPWRARRGSQLVTAHEVALLAGADGVLPLRWLASVQSAGGGLS